MAYPPHHHGFMFHSLDQDNNNNLPSPTSLPSCPPQLFHGHFSSSVSCEEGHGDDDLSDDGSQLLGEKKKRLNLEQVKALEKSFELGNKLEPDRKVQLAKALGLQPRQIAIWFQNRRARWKTKQLEKDYDVLKKQFEALKADNDALQAQNKKLHSELSVLKSKDTNSIEINLKKLETDQGSWSNGSTENSSPVITSPTLSPQINGHGKNFFPTSASNLTQFLQGSSRPDINCLKIDQVVQDGSNFCNMFNGAIEEQQNFWQWPDQQQQFH
ncbi:hypothetical protein ACFE04_010912 [Oxalis oulophora]